MKKKYFILDNIITKRAVLFMNGPFETEEEAIKEADVEWRSMSNHDKNQRDAFYIGYGYVEPVSKTECTFVEDENGNFLSDHDVIKEYK